MKVRLPADHRRAPAEAAPVQTTERDALAAADNWGSDDPAGPYRRFRCRFYWRCVDHMG